MDLGQRVPDDLGADYLIFTSQYMGSEAGYLKALANELGDVWDGCDTADAARPARMAAAAPRCRRPTSSPATRRGTVDRIERDLHTRRRLAEDLHEEPTPTTVGRTGRQRRSPTARDLGMDQAGAPAVVTRARRSRTTSRATCSTRMASSSRTPSTRCCGSPTTAGAREAVAAWIGAVTFGRRPDPLDRRAAREPRVHPRAGSRALGVPPDVLSAFPEDFTQGARARSRDEVGDRGPNAADHWEPAYRDPHVLLSVHAGSAPMARERLDELLAEARDAAFEPPDRAAHRAAGRSAEQPRESGKPPSCSAATRASTSGSPTAAPSPRSRASTTTPRGRAVRARPPARLVRTLPAGDGDGPPGQAGVAA